MVDFGRKQASNKVRFFAFHYRAVHEANVSFWHKADIPAAVNDVRFRGVKRTWRIYEYTLDGRSRRCRSNWLDFVISGYVFFFCWRFLSRTPWASAVLIDEFDAQL